MFLTPPGRRRPAPRWSALLASVYLLGGAYTRWRGMVRYQFGHDISGWSFGLAISF